jgi:hypothetical protein
LKGGAPNQRFAKRLLQRSTALVWNGFLASAVLAGYLLAMSDVTRILSQIKQGDPQASEKLLPLVYDELRKLAAVKLAGESRADTASNCLGP